MPAHPRAYTEQGYGWDEAQAPLLNSPHSQGSVAGEAASLPPSTHGFGTRQPKGDMGTASSPSGLGQGPSSYLNLPSPRELHIWTLHLKPNALKK